MIENTPKKISIPRYHLAGIVPVSSTLKTDYGMIWPDVLMPLAPNYTIIENAILTAVYAGCETIWVVMDTKTIKLFKEILGDWVRDPTTLNDYFISREEKRIPIIYVPVRPIDFRKRESIPWSIISGVNAAYKTMVRLTRWVTPDCFFVSFPFGVVDLQIIRENRRLISSRKRFYCSHEEKTVKDGYPLPFTFFLKDFAAFKAKYKENASGRYIKDEETDKNLDLLKTKKELPFEERYSGRWFGIKDVFDIAKIEEEDIVINLNWFHDVSSWEGYRGYMSNEKTSLIQRPNKKIFPIAKYRRWTPIGMDEEINMKEEENE